MQVLSRKALLALEAVVDVAIYARPDPVQARDITERLQVPQRYLEQIMQALVRADILRGVRGPRGGYRLARERRRISAAEVIEVINHLEYGEEKRALRSRVGQATLTPLCNSLANTVNTALCDITIQDLCQDAPLPSAEASHEDFTI